MRTSVLAGSLAIVMLGAQAHVETAAQQPIPDAPQPQATLPNLRSVTPGKGTTSTSAGDSVPDAGTPTVPSSLPSTLPAAQSEAPAGDASAPYVPSAADGFKALTIRGAGINFVQVPFTVKDAKGRLVAGLHPYDVQVTENGLRQQLTLFINSPLPMSVAFVIDQSLTHSDMTRVNDALGAVQAAFAPYDEVAWFTYNNGPKMVTDFTGSQSARLTSAIETSKSSGRDALMAGELDGPLAQTTVINNQNFDPNTSSNRGHSTTIINTPRDVHTLNDAILAAAISLSKAERGRTRVIYVISDGKEYGSVAKPKDVVRYLQTNKIGVYGTLVGDSSLPVIGFLDKIHLPLMMQDNRLASYAKETGGNFDAEFRTGGIEKSFAKIAEEVRNQYVIGYNTHENPLDSKFRKLDVIILNHGNDLTVLAKPGYYPSALDTAPPRVLPAQ